MSSGKMPGVFFMLGMFCAVIVPMTAASGGILPPCSQDMLCLKDFNKENFHRLKLECSDLTVNLDKNGDILDRNVSYDHNSRCIIWKSGILTHCAVTETDYNGRKSSLHFTYNCTQRKRQVFSTLITPTPTPGDPTLTAASSRHYWYLAAGGAFIVSVLAFWIYLNWMKGKKQSGLGEVSVT